MIPTNKLTWWFNVTQYWRDRNKRGTALRGIRLSCGHRFWLYWYISSSNPKRRKCDECRSMHAQVRWSKVQLQQERDEGKPLSENPDVVDAMVCKCGRCTGAK